MNEETREAFYELNRLSAAKIGWTGRSPSTEALEKAGLLADNWPGYKITPAGEARIVELLAKLEIAPGFAYVCRHQDGGMFYGFERRDTVSTIEGTWDILRADMQAARRTRL